MAKMIIDIDNLELEESSVKTLNKCPSEYIENFLNFLNEIKVSYNNCSDELHKQDLATSDFLHSLELGELNCGERSKLATKLMTNRKDRRYFKDRVEEYQPIIDFMEDKNNQKIINKLKEVLGQVRKQEDYHKDRFYIPRVIKQSKTKKEVES